MGRSEVLDELLGLPGTWQPEDKVVFEIVQR